MSKAITGERQKVIIHCFEGSYNYLIHNQTNKRSELFRSLYCIEIRCMIIYSYKRSI